MPWFFDFLNPMLWIVSGGVLVFLIFLFILFKWLLGRKY